jgi:hypothetical protein
MASMKHTMVATLRASRVLAERRQRGAVPEG